MGSDFAPEGAAAQAHRNGADRTHAGGGQEVCVGRQAVGRVRAYPR
jgi:hypothetical protein